ncbi:unnamed protein product [Echinostoma caproni]|uniref:Transmembrane protein n=1 Tax=Echinostoma caproni TaxID=27848 RepID=A0A183A5V6_9TREM|nr:unnamed protein product [Echinostoma caproni]
MDPIYSAAKGIVHQAQPILDGGIFTFVLNNYVAPRLILTEADELTIVQKDASPSPTEHMRVTFARSGYAVAIAFGIIWTIILFVVAVILCGRKSGRRRRHTPDLVYLAGLPSHPNDISRCDGTIRSNASTRFPKSTLHRTRHRMQSNWICLAIQFFLLTSLTLLLGIGVMLGFSASSQLHGNLAAPSTHEEAVGRLLKPNELKHTDPPATHVFPRILRALAQVRAYLSEFVEDTKKSTAPVVLALINATEAMQDRMTTEFNALLFDEIGASKAFQLGDEVGSSVISLMKHSMGIVEQDMQFKQRFDRFKIELQNWLRLIQGFGPTGDEECVGTCVPLRATFTNNLTARPDTFMPHFAFAVALKFVTTDQNQTADSVQQQLNQGRLLAEKQLAETKKVMAERINIPKTITEMVDSQWASLDTQMAKMVETIDTQALIITRSLAPKVSSGSSVLLTFACIFWIVLLLFTVGITWLIIHYHCVPSSLSVRSRHRVRSAAGCCLLFLVISLITSTLLFLFAGYLYTEGCRYLEPTEEQSHSKSDRSPADLLDAHINWFIDRHWDVIVRLAANHTPPGAKPMPVPHVRSPLRAMMHHCRENAGILAALDGIRDFNMASLNDPKVAEQFVRIGREIMFNSLKALDVNEMFPKETDEQLKTAGLLDGFIVNFQQFRDNLPTTYLSVRLPDDESGNYTLLPVESMWSAWDAYYATVLQFRLTDKQRLRLDRATQEVRLALVNLNAIVTAIDTHLVALSSAKKVSPIVTELKSTLSNLKSLMSNKPVLLNKASKLFDEHIQTKTPTEAEKLIVEFGPQLMAEVGRCRRLYEAENDMKRAVCDGVVVVLNGLWFVTGWVTLVGSITVGCGLALLLHKTPLDTSGPSAKPFLSKTLQDTRDEFFGLNAQQRTGDANESNRFTQAPELERLNTPDEHPRLSIPAQSTPTGSSPVSSFQTHVHPPMKLSSLSPPPPPPPPIRQQCDSPQQQQQRIQLPSVTQSSLDNKSED